MAWFKCALWCNVRPYLVDSELPLKATAVAVVERNLHRVVYVAHLVSTHLILDVQAHH